jgi:hypothetical protein
MNGQQWSGAAAGGNNNGWVTVVDANEGAFSIQMPAGWQNQAATLRPYGQLRTVVTSQSPDGTLFLFAGDPNLPGFTEPTSMYAEVTMMNQNPLMQIHPYVAADTFFPQYLQGRYGRAPGFRITSIGPNPTIEQRVYAQARERGMQAHFTCVLIQFEFQDNGMPVHGVLNGTVLVMNGNWFPDVSGVCTTGDVNRGYEMLMQMMNSYQANAGWRQQQDNLHHQRMNQIQQDHQSAMASMQAGHQARMDAIHQAGAVNTQIWQERQQQNDASHQSFIDSIRSTPASVESGGGFSDVSHQRFLNAIKEQETVLDGSGQSYQVEAGHERYYVNKRDNTYIGTGATTEREDLRKRGLNPDDYEEVRIKR